MASEDGAEVPTPGVAHSHPYYRACEIELSDDGSSIVSESEHDHSSARGRRPSSSAKFRKGSSQLSPSTMHYAPSSPLNAYPVSIRQQLAMIKMMEQNASESGGAGSSAFGSSSPHSLNTTPRNRRIPKIHKKNERGETPLHVAASRGEYRQVKKLLQEGAHINAVDYAGWTPLHDACNRARFKVAKILISNGADVNAASDCGDTPLHDAAARGCEKLAWLLLRSGADRERNNHAGKKPIDVCPLHCTAVRALLASVAVPEKCPSGGDSLSDTSPTDYHVEIRHPLTISVGSPTVGSSIKQPTPSPAETETTVHSETCLQGEGIDYHRGIDMQLSEEKEAHEDLESEMDRTLVHEDEAGAEIGEASSKDNLQSGEASVTTRRPVWGNEDKSSVKNEEGLEAEAEDAEQEGGAHNEEESSGTEPRRWVRTRGTPRKIAICQEKVTSFPEKRKQRGRRRQKIMPSVARTLVLPQAASAPDDVYEFRCSPEIETNDNGQMDVGDDHGASPDAKRQRLEGTFVHVSGVSLTIKQEEEHPVDHQEVDEVAGNVTEPVEESAGSRKVPPLRISLTRTPSEDTPVTASAEEATSVAAGTRNGTKRNNRVPKNQIKKELTPADDVPTPASDNGLHRMTRSRVRQAGRTIKEETSSVYCESTVKRKGQGRLPQRASFPSVSNVSSPMPATTTVEKDEAEASTDAPLFNATSASTSEEASCFATLDAPSAIALSFMRKNTYEGFRGLRGKIEESWMSVLAQPPPNSVELPANYNDYMIVKKNCTLRGNIDEEKLAVKFDAGLKFAPELQELRRSQDEKRIRMEMKHKVERERLQMLAEREVLRMLNRKANSNREAMSAVRVLRETDIYNTWYLKERSEDHPVVEYDQIKAKFAAQVRSMVNRQKMESDALFAEQVYSWNQVIKNVGHPFASSLKDNVPKVMITHLDLKL